MGARSISYATVRWVSKGGIRGFPSDRQQQFGATIGGPTARDKMLLLAGYDRHILPSVAQFGNGATVVVPHFLKMRFMTRSRFRRGRQRGESVVRFRLYTIFLAYPQIHGRVVRDSLNLVNRDNQWYGVTGNGHHNSAETFVKRSQSWGGAHYPTYYQQHTSFLRSTSSYAPRRMQLSMGLDF